MPIASNLKAIQTSLPKEVTLVAVSKTKPNTAILEAYKQDKEYLEKIKYKN